MDHGVDLFTEVGRGGDSAAVLASFAGAVDLDEHFDRLIAFESDGLNLFDEAQGVDRVDQARDADDLLDLVALEVADHVPADRVRVVDGVGIRSALTNVGDDGAAAEQLIHHGGPLGQLQGAAFTEVAVSEADQFADLFHVGVLGDGDNEDLTRLAPALAGRLRDAVHDLPVSLGEARGRFRPWLLTHGLLHHLSGYALAARRRKECALIVKIGPWSGGAASTYNRLIAPDSAPRIQEEIMPNEQLTPRNSPISVGESAPDFTLTDQNRQEWRLSDAVKKSDMVLCFYPMDFSPVCSTEMKCVTDEMDKFEKKGAQVVGISCDSFFVHKAWADSIGLKQTLLADMHRAVSKAYGLYFPDLNVSARGTVVIGKDASGAGKVKWVQSRELRTAMTNDEVLKAID